MLLTRSPLSGGRSHLRARLACVKHAASVHSEPGSNSPVCILVRQDRLKAPSGLFRSESRIVLPAPPRIGGAGADVRVLSLTLPLFSFQRTGALEARPVSLRESAKGVNPRLPGLSAIQRAQRQTADTPPPESDSTDPMAGGGLTRPAVSRSLPTAAGRALGNSQPASRPGP